MWTKLKREWKTASLAVAASAVGIWDTVSASGYDLSPIIPDQYRPYAVPAVGISFLLLRKWTDPKVTKETTEVTTTEKTE